MTKKTLETSKNKGQSDGVPSKAVLSDPLRRPGRHWLSASGVTPAQMGLPFIGVVVCTGDVLGASPHVENLVQNIERGIQQGGGVCFRLKISGMVEGLAEGHDGQSYLFPRRQILADEVECLARGAGLEGLVLVADQNDGAAGLLLGAARLALPAVFVPVNGSLNTDKVPGEATDALRFMAEELLKARKKPGTYVFSTNGHTLPRDDYYQAVISCLAEVMGLSYSQAATVPTGSPEQMRLALASGQRAVELVRQGFDVRRVLMPNAFMNALRLDAAFGGSPDAVVFLLSLAMEAGIKLSLDHVADLGLKTPQVCHLGGGKIHGLRHLHAAGGLPAVLRALKGQWLPHPTVSGRGINDVIKLAQIKDGQVIRVKTPFRKEGGLAVFRGNLAPQGAVFQIPPSFPKKLATFTGLVRVFDSKELALEALLQKKIKKGDALVVRYEGSKGGSGYRPLALVGQLLAAQGLDETVPFITDGHMGIPLNSGLTLEMACPEAGDGATLSVLRDGDRLTIDVAARRLMVHLTDTDMKVRLARWQAPPGRARSAFLARQSRATGSVLEGAVPR